MTTTKKTKLQKNILIYCNNHLYERYSGTKEEQKDTKEINREKIESYTETQNKNEYGVK